MDRYVWDPSLETGFDRIDQEHRDLFQLANALDTCVRDKACESVVGEAVFRLVDHVVKHFREEEELMAATRYPGLDEHRIEHQRLSEQTLTFTANCLDGNSPRVPEVALVVSRWLRDHIQDHDRALAEYLRDAPLD